MSPPTEQPERATQEEIKEQAELAPDDPHTEREEKELDLMEQDDSQRGERLGQPLD